MSYGQYFSQRKLASNASSSSASTSSSIVQHQPHHQHQHQHPHQHQQSAGSTSKRPISGSTAGPGPSVLSYGRAVEAPFLVEEDQKTSTTTSNSAYSNNVGFSGGFPDWPRVSGTGGGAPATASRTRRMLGRLTTAPLPQRAIKFNEDEEANSASCSVSAEHNIVSSGAKDSNNTRGLTVSGRRQPSPVGTRNLAETLSRTVEPRRNLHGSSHLVVGTDPEQGHLALKAAREFEESKAESWSRTNRFDPSDRMRHLSTIEVTGGGSSSATGQALLPTRMNFCSSASSGNSSINNTENSKLKNVNHVLSSPEKSGRWHHSSYGTRLASRSPSPAGKATAAAAAPSSTTTATRGSILKTSSSLAASSASKRAINGQQMPSSSASAMVPKINCENQENDLNASFCEDSTSGKVLSSEAFLHSSSKERQQQQQQPRRTILSSIRPNSEVKFDIPLERKRSAGHSDDDDDDEADDDVDLLRPALSGVVGFDDHSNGCRGSSRRSLSSPGFLSRHPREVDAVANHHYDPSNPMARLPKKEPYSHQIHQFPAGRSGPLHQYHVNREMDVSGRHHSSTSLGDNHHQYQGRLLSSSSTSSIQRQPPYLPSSVAASMNLTKESKGIPGSLGEGGPAPPGQIFHETPARKELMASTGLRHLPSDVAGGHSGSSLGGQLGDLRPLHGSVAVAGSSSASASSSRHLQEPYHHNNQASTSSHMSEQLLTNVAAFKPAIRSNSTSSKSNSNIEGVNYHKWVEVEERTHGGLSNKAQQPASIMRSSSNYLDSGLSMGQPPPPQQPPLTSSSLMHHHTQQQHLSQPGGTTLPKSVKINAPPSGGGLLANRECSPMEEQRSLCVNGHWYSLVDKVGAGGSSVVYRALDTKNQLVAIKRVDLTNTSAAEAEGFRNEINLLIKLRGNRRIVQLFDYEEAFEVGGLRLLYLVMEYGEKDLAKILKELAASGPELLNRGVRCKGGLTDAKTKFYWEEMLEAVQVIHNEGIVHSDLKPANFLIVGGTLKLIDFGIASTVADDKTHVTKDNLMGTFNFMSPEAIRDLSKDTGSSMHRDSRAASAPVVKISYKSDVWSLGCILYNMVYGRMPFGDIKHPIAKLQAIMDPKHEIRFDEGVGDHDPQVIDVLKKCLVRDPAQRAPIEELLSNGYLRTSYGGSSTPKSRGSGVAGGPAAEGGKSGRSHFLDHANTAEGLLNAFSSLTPNSKRLVVKNLTGNPEAL